MKNRLLKLVQDNLKAEKKFDIRAEGDTPEIFLYDAIGDWYGISAEAFVKALAQFDGQDVLLRINSPGGDVFEGRAMATAIQQHRGKVTAQIDGLAASAATYVATAAASTRISQGAFFMIHYAWTLAIGNADELETTAGLLRKVDGSIVNDYLNKTGQEEAQIREWMKAETWFTADEAVEYGFADSLLEGQSTAANLWNLSAYNNAPAALLASRQPEEQPQYDRALAERRLALLERIAA
jgi:ATP-dependent Clp endopeptidase proteolytic subunit ClpP|tara:strand:+ start:345 stop:1061 length:717 start_codon:yes stop_codon:yes gene_type:complete